MRELIEWFKSDPIGATACVCICLMMGSCTVRSIVSDWGCAPHAQGATR